MLKAVRYRIVVERKKFGEIDPQAFLTTSSGKSCLRKFGLSAVKEIGGDGRLKEDGALNLFHDNG